MAYQINLTGQEIDDRLQNIGFAEDVAAADGTLYARISKNADDVDELRDAVGHIDSAQTATDKTVTQHTADISTLQTAVKTKANLVDGKVSVTELPIATSLGNPNNGTIPSTLAVNEAINNKVVGLLHWQGVKSTTSEIKSITSAKKGDVWHSNEDGSEWVCTEDISTVNDSAWTELGTPVNLSGYYTKTEVDKKVKPLADSIGTDNDAASANGSLYARIKKNATDIYDCASKLSSGTLRDLYISAGAVYNEATGFYELNGLTDITEEEMRTIYEKTWGWWLALPNLSGFGDSSARTNIPCPDYKRLYYQGNCNFSSTFVVTGNVDNLEVLNFNPIRYPDRDFTKLSIRNMNWMCQDNAKPLTIMGNFDVGNVQDNDSLNIGGNIKTIYIKNLSKNIKFYNSNVLSKESVLYLINNAKPQSGAAAGSIAIALHSTAYARLKDDADIVAALEAKNGVITLVSA